MATNDTDTPVDNAVRLSDYLDGELSEQERVELEAELESDEGLQAELLELQKTLGALQGLSSQVAPDDFVQDIESKIRVRSRGRFFDDDFFYRTRMPYELFAVVMFILMGAMYFYALPDAPNLGDDVAAMGGEPTGEEPEGGSQPEGDSPTGDRGAKGEGGKSDKIKEDGAKEDADKGDKDAPQGESPEGKGEGKDEGQEGKVPDGAEQGALPGNGAAPPAKISGAADKAPKSRKVVPIRREIVVYTLKITDNNPARRAKTMAGQIRAMGRQFKVTSSGSKVQVDLPQSQVGSILSAFGKQGRVSSMRLYAQSDKLDVNRTTIHIQVSAPGKKNKKANPRFP